MASMKLRLPFTLLLLAVTAFGASIQPTFDFANLDEPLVQSSSCGGVLDGLAGAINYKPDEATKDGEICIWTVRTKQKGTIQFQILEDGFNQDCENCQLVSIYELNHRTKFVPSQVLQLNHGDRNVYQVNGPLIYIIFTTRLQSGYTGNGFSLLLAGIGEDVVDPNLYGNQYEFDLRHYDVNSDYQHTERFLYANTNPKYKITSIVLQPPRNRRINLHIPAPFRTGYGHYNSYCGSPFSVQEIRWQESSTRLSYCRSDLDYSSTVASPMPLIVTFYSYVLNVPGFQLEWHSPNI